MEKKKWEASAVKKRDIWNIMSNHYGYEKYVTYILHLKAIGRELTSLKEIRTEWR